MQSKIFRELELKHQENKLIETSKLREQYAIPTPNLVLLSLYIDHILYEEFTKLENLAKQLFLNETNISVKMLFLDKAHDFYQVC